MNGCPLRRINQIYVIATQTKINIDNVKLPERLTDDFFRRKKLNKPKMGEGDIFESKKEVSVLAFSDSVNLHCKADEEIVFEL